MDKKSPQRRNIKKSEQGQPLSRIKAKRPKNFVVAFSRTQPRGGRH